MNNYRTDIVAYEITAVMSAGLQRWCRILSRYYLGAERCPSCDLPELNPS
jgi:hypothetical protein